MYRFTNVERDDIILYGGRKMSEMISVVVSVYNEELSLQRFFETITNVLSHCDVGYEIIFVNDGSSDKSGMILNSLANQDTKGKRH